MDNDNFVILDVRTPGEYYIDHIEDSILIDVQDPSFLEEVSKLDKDLTYLVYCRSGRRSAEASDILVDLGFNDVYNMTGGILDWEAAGFPTVQ